jgi:hypothetical protein
MPKDGPGVGHSGNSMEKRSVSRHLFFAVIVLLVATDLASAQQMVIMKKNKIVTRFEAGDELLFQFKDDKQPNRVIIQSIREFYLVTTSGDSIDYQRVGRILFRNPDRQKYGAMVFGTGVALLAIWGVNSLAFDTTSPSMRGLQLVGFFGVGLGTFIYFTANSGVKIKPGTRLKYISYDSPLYR